MRLFASAALAACLLSSPAAAIYDMNGADPALTAARSNPVRAARAPARAVRAAAAPTEAVFAFGASIFGPGAWLEARVGTNPTGWARVWCGRAVRMALKATGYADHAPGDMAGAWATYGTPAPAGAPGSIRYTAAHVGIVIGPAPECGPGRIRMVSGNSVGRTTAFTCEPIYGAGYRYPTTIGPSQAYMQPEPRYVPRRTYRRVARR